MSTFYISLIALLSVFSLGQAYTVELQYIDLFFDVGEARVDDLPLTGMNIDLRIKENQVLFQQYLEGDDIRPLEQDIDMVCYALSCQLSTLTGFFFKLSSTRLNHS